MNARILFASILAAALPAAAAAKEPAQDISASRHGNLAAAQSLFRQAYDRLAAAQQANEFDMGGLAATAKQLLQQAIEIKLAALAANSH